jgi:hypothetical protein
MVRKGEMHKTKTEGERKRAVDLSASLFLSPSVFVLCISPFLTIFMSSLLSLVALSLPVLPIVLTLFMSPLPCMAG